MKTSHNLSDAYDPMGDMLAREAMQCHAHGCDGATSARPRLSSRVRQRRPENPALGPGAGAQRISNPNQGTPMCTRNQEYCSGYQLSIMSSEMSVSICRADIHEQRLDDLYVASHAVDIVFHNPNVIGSPFSARKLDHHQVVEYIRQVSAQPGFILKRCLQWYLAQSLDCRVAPGAQAVMRLARSPLRPGQNVDHPANCGISDDCSPRECRKLDSACVLLATLVFLLGAFLLFPNLSQGFGALFFRERAVVVSLLVVMLTVLRALFLALSLRNQSNGQCDYCRTSRRNRRGPSRRGSAGQEFFCIYKEDADVEEDEEDKQIAGYPRAELHVPRQSRFSPRLVAFHPRIPNSNYAIGM